MLNTSGPTCDLFSDEFCLGVGGKFYASANARSKKVRLVVNKEGIETIFEVSNETALAIAEAIRAVAICAKHS
jgi:hypothetical protein